MQPLTFHDLNSPGAPAFYKHIISSWTQYMLTLNTCVASIFVPRPYLMLHPLWQLSSIMLHENLMRGHNDCPLLLTLKNILLCLESRLRVILTQWCPAPTVNVVSGTYWSTWSCDHKVQRYLAGLWAIQSWIENAFKIPDFGLSVANKMQNSIWIGM